jgi:alpha-glucosidase
MVMWNADVADYPAGHDPSYAAIPFFIALHEGRSYGLFFNNTWRSWFDMGKREPHRYSFGANGGTLDYYVFTGGEGRTPAGVLRDYTALTGRGALPPLWALGYQQSRWSYMSQEKVLDVAHAFRQRRIPADVLYLDIDHMDGFRVFTWNPATFPDPKAMLGQLHADGFHAVTIVDPGIKVDERYPVYRSGREQGVYLRNADGSELHAKVWPGVCAFPDFTSPAARAWFGRLYATALDLGVDGFWNDMNEPGVFPADGFDKPEISLGPQRTLPLGVRHAGDGMPGTHAQYHNVYGMQMARASFEGLRSLAAGPASAGAHARRFRRRAALRRGLDRRQFADLAAPRADHPDADQFVGVGRPVRGRGRGRLHGQPERGTAHPLAAGGSADALLARAFE